MFCNKCGKEVDEKYKFCNFCGTPIKNSQRQNNKINNINKSKNDLSKNPIFILGIVFLGILMYTFIFVIYPSLIKNDSIQTNSNITVNDIEEKTELNQNPFQILNDYDGAYEFTIEDDNGLGHIFKAKGIIIFDNGVCKAKYKIISDSYNREEKVEGYCGLSTDSRFYFSILNSQKKEQYKYLCQKNENILKCVQISRYNIVGCNLNHDLQLKYKSNSKDIDNIYNEFKTEYEKEEAKKQEEDFKSKCNEYTFEQLARNPDKIKGNSVKVKGKVIQVLESKNTISLRVNITKDSYGYYKDTIYVTYINEAGADRILEDDIITIWGGALGNYKYTSILGAEITLPWIEAEYVELEK